MTLIIMHILTHDKPGGGGLRTALSLCPLRE